MNTCMSVCVSPESYYVDARTLSVLQRRGMTSSGVRTTAATSVNHLPNDEEVLFTVIDAGLGLRSSTIPGTDLSIKGFC